PICKFFVRGMCSKGYQCRFRHDQIYPESLESQVTPLTMKPCKYFVEGACTMGDSCLFSHDIVVQSQGRWQTRRDYPRTASACRYFAQGNCRKGGSCTFLH
ncbi:hypothetical protein B0H10DRAFT_1648007, partial [Mycena sp. CBHHK59/15]